MSEFSLQLGSETLRRANEAAFKGAREAEMSLRATWARFPSAYRPYGDRDILLRAGHDAASELCRSVPEAPASDAVAAVAEIAAKAAVKKIFVERELVFWSVRALRHQAQVSTPLLRLGAMLLPRAARGRWVVEWCGELASLPTRRARLRFTIQLLIGIPRLTATLRNPSPQDALES